MIWMNIIALSLDLEPQVWWLKRTEPVIHPNNDGNDGTLMSQDRALEDSRDGRFICVGEVPFFIGFC